MYTLRLRIMAQLKMVQVYAMAATLYKTYVPCRRQLIVKYLASPRSRYLPPMSNPDTTEAHHCPLDSAGRDHPRRSIERA